MSIKLKNLRIQAQNVDNSSTKYYEGLGKAMKERVNQTGTFFNFATYGDSDFPVTMPDMSQYNNLGVQIAFNSTSTGGNIEIHFSNDGSLNASAVSNVAIAAGVSNNFISIPNFTARFLVLRFVGFTAGEITNFTLLGKR